MKNPLLLDALGARNTAPSVASVSPGNTGVPDTQQSTLELNLVFFF